MHEYDEAVLKCFLKHQSKLFPEDVASSMEEAEAFLEDSLAVVLESADEVREYFDAEGLDPGEGDILDASEVFDIGDGRYLVVEG